MISCQNVTGSDLDVCCGQNDCCNSGIGRIRLSSRGEPVKEISGDDARPLPITKAMASPTAYISGKVTDWVIPKSTLFSNETALPPSSSSPTGLGVKVGIGVGSGVGAITLFALVFMSLYRRRKAQLAISELDINHLKVVGTEDNGSMAPLELNGSRSSSERDLARENELRAGEVAYEMPADAHVN